MVHFTEDKMLPNLRASSLTMNLRLGPQLDEHGSTTGEQRPKFLEVLVCVFLTLAYLRNSITIDLLLGTSAENVAKSLVRREIACLERFPSFPRDTQQGIFGGPGGYHPTKEAKLSVLHDFLKIRPHLLPKEEKLSTGVLWHNDLHMHNIFVDSENPSQITSIIDWQGTPIYPIFLICHHPSLIEYEGPELDGFSQPVLPENIRTLDPRLKRLQRICSFPSLCGLPTK